MQARREAKRAPARGRAGGERSGTPHARQALLDAAVELFAERGFRTATVDDVVGRAGYSKGAFYWHFSSKDDLFFTLFDERIDRPWREAIELLESADPDHDMAPEASRRLGQVLAQQRAMLLIGQEYWLHAARDDKLRRRYAKRQAKLRAALGTAIAARLERLGAPPLESAAQEQLAAAFIGMAIGLSQQKLISPDAFPDSVLGDTFALIYAGHVARAGRTADA
jgi:AcrR family transcriptional regulator